MLAPKSWLSDFVSLAGISDERFSREMTFAGNKVESMQKMNGKVVYEFEITSNRPDTLSIIGLAREAAAVLDRELKLPKLPKTRNFNKNPIPLKIDDAKICPVFSVVELDGITIRPSSPLIRQRLEASNVRPINNVVDIANYVMLETGQPMHTFDANRLRGILTLRTAKPNEQIIPLDHKKRVLLGGEIIIEDKEKLVDLAGLMGGLNSEISDRTEHVYLLVPIYNPVAIRRASKHLRLRTEASARFEKKLDLTQTETVAIRAVLLLEKETGGKQTTSIVTHINEKWMAPTIPLSLKKVTSLVGRSFTKEEIGQYLAKVGVVPVMTRSQFLSLRGKSDVPWQSHTKTDRHGLQKGLAMTSSNNILLFQPPSWRRDITITEDLIEEVTRLYGYNRFKRSLPTGEIPINPDSLTPNWRRIVAERCAALSYTETYSSTLIGKTLIEELKLYPTKEHLKVLRPMSGDFEYMRRTTLETLIPFLKQNLVDTDKINIFELGTIFIPSRKSFDLPDQPLELGILSTTHSYEQIRGHVEDIAKTLGVTLDFIPSKSSQVIIRLGKTSVGNLDLIAKAYAVSLNMTELFKTATTAFHYPQLSGYPPIIEDLTLKRPSGKFLGEALRIIENSSELIQKVEYVGEYQGYVTLRLIFQSLTNSLTQDEVNVIKASLLRKLEPLGWTLKIL